MKVNYKILFDRDNHTNKVQTQIAKAKDYLNSTLRFSKVPYFCNVGFCGGADVENNTTTFEITMFIDDNVKLRYDLNNYILDTFKGCDVWLFENNLIPHKIS